MWPWYWTCSRAALGWAGAGARFETSQGALKAWCARPLRTTLDDLNRSHELLVIIHMYAIILRYKVPLTEVDRHVEAHRAWLREHYAAGHFLLSGAQRPRVGGFILAAAIERAKLDAILNGDAFKIADVADYEIIDVAANMASPALAFLAESA